MVKTLFCVLLAFSLTACLVTIDSDSRPITTVWNEGEVSRLQVGVTDQDFVRTSFGEPITRLRYADGTEVWKYRNRSEKDTEVGVFLLFAIDVEQEREETLSVEFVDGIVSDYWIEVQRY